MLRFAGEARELIDFLIGAQIFRSDEQSDFAAGKFRDQAVDERNRQVRRVIHGKENFVVGIVLAAKARVIFVSGEIYAAHWLEQAHARSVVSRQALALAAEKTPGGKGGRDVIREWRGRQKKHRIAPS